ncbi:MFS general substrate transporter [Marasmius fiardii PR-910]|nr:MFS general substrate transporter [Marasmius fiardii PR-910]
MDPESNSIEGKPKPTPLPHGQLLLVLLIQSSEAITGTVIYPFIAQLIRNTGITQGDEAKVGYYAGIIESIFFVSESAVCYFWGRASDKFGRRPILLLGPLGLAVAMTAFGLSRTFWPLVAFRALQGVSNGNIGVARTVMAELTDSTNMADAFMLVPIMWAFGVTLAPMMGGFLAEPANTWPNVFGKVPLFVNYPFFLPCFVAGMYAFSAFVIPLFRLRETHPSFQSKNESRSHNSDVSSQTCPLLDHNECSNYESTTTRDQSSHTNSTTTTLPATPLPPAPTSTSILNPALKIVLLNYCFLNFTDMSYAVIIPILYSTSNSLGGLGFSSKRIGALLGLYSLSNAFIQIGVFKKILKRIGARRMYRIAYSSVAIPILMLMCEQWLVNRYGKVTGWVWAAIVVQFVVAMMINTMYGAISLLTVDAASPGTLGAVNGLSQMLASGVRGLAPFVASSLFSLSLQSQICGGYFVYIVLLGVAAAGTMCAFMIPRSLT